MGAHTLTGSISPSASLGAEAPIDRAPTYTLEDRKSVLGYRASTPLVVRSIDVLNPYDIIKANVPTNGQFLASALFAGGSGDPLHRAGAAPGSVGTRIVQSVSAAEGAGINQCKYSEALGTPPWTVVDGVVVTVNGYIAPDGQQTADMLEDKTVGALASLQQAIVIADDSKTRMFSVHVLKTTSAKQFPGITLAYTGGGAIYKSVTINTDDGTLTDRTGQVPDDKGVEDAGNCWRVWIAAANDSSGNTSCSLRMYPAVNTDASASWTVTTKGPAVFWGIQLELSSTVSPYAKTTTGVNTTLVHYPFRVPVNKEVVWYVAVDSSGNYTDQGLYRWDGSTWLEYKSWPERGLEAQYAFEFLDPDRIYAYYARVVGSTMSGWNLDGKALLDLLDPDKCPVSFLPDLAGQYGLTFNEGDSEAVKREKIRQAIPTFKEKGLELGVRKRLQSLMYGGYAKEIWANPDNPSNYVNDDSGEKGTDWIEVWHGSKIDVPHIGLRFIESENPRDGETVEIDDYTTQVTFEFDDDASVGGGNTSVTIGATTAITRNNLVAAINAAALTVKATATPLAEFAELDLDSGKIASDSLSLLIFNNYWPSSRVSVHLTQRDGKPIDMTAPTAEMDALKELIAKELCVDILCATTDIRFFATDLEVSTDFTNEALEITDVVFIWPVDRLTGSIPVTATLAGMVVPGMAISGGVAVSVVLAGGLTGQAVLLGSIAVTATLAGGVLGVGAISGSIAVAAALAGDLVYFGVIQGGVAGGAAPAGDLIGAAVLQGSIAVAATLAGDLVHTPA